jgi:vancomycin resistance protein YoaR
LRQTQNAGGGQNYLDVSNWAYSVPIVENDPEMAKLAESESELAHSADEILSQYIAAEKADDQKRLKSEMRDMLAKQFDVQRQRRELELSSIEARVKKLHEQIKKRSEARETIIDRRLEQLTNEAEGLGWGQPAGAVTIPQHRAMYRTGPKAP